MTPTEKYNEVIASLGELLKEKNDTISLLQFQKASLEGKLKAAETLIEHLAAEKEGSISNE